MRELLDKAHQQDDDDLFKEEEDDEEFAQPSQSLRRCDTSSGLSADESQLIYGMSTWMSSLTPTTTRLKTKRPKNGS